MSEVFDSTNFNFHQNKFNNILGKIQTIIVDTGNNTTITLNSNLNQLLRVLMYNQLEFEFNYPKADSIVMLQSRYNLTFQDAQKFTASRYMFFKINLISILYYTLEQYSDNLLLTSNLNDKLNEKTFRNKYSLLLSESKVKEFKNKNDIVSVFKFIRASFHAGGIHHGEHQVYQFGNIKYEFIDNKSPELTTESLLYLIEKIVDIIFEITKSEKFFKFFKT